MVGGASVSLAKAIVVLCLGVMRVYAALQVGDFISANAHKIRAATP